MFARQFNVMSNFGGDWHKKVLDLRGEWPRLMVHAGHLWLADSQLACPVPKSLDLIVHVCVVWFVHLNSQVLIQLNKTRPVDDPFVLRVRNYMEVYGVLAAYCPLHVSVRHLHIYGCCC